MGPIRGHRRRGFGGRTLRGFKKLAAGSAATVLLIHPATAAGLALANPALPLADVLAAAGAVSLAAAAGLWALAERSNASNLKRTLRGVAARNRAAVGARDALIAAGREAVLVWGHDTQAPVSYGGAELILDSVLAGPDALAVSQAIDALSAKGAAFTLAARDKDGKSIALRGRAVGGMAALWLEELRETATQTPDFKIVLDALPIPVWLRDKALSLFWGNRVFLAAAGAADEESAIAQQASLDKSERDLASAARAEGHALESKRFAIVGGQRRALAFTHVPLEDGRVVGSAVDVTDVSAAETRLQQTIDANSDTLNKLATAVAIFGKNQNLDFYNRAYAQLWGLPEAWLDTHPSDGEILDRLRDARRLPEQRNYPEWKRERLKLYEQPGEYLMEELWHVPGGKTLRVVPQPHPFGGLTFLYEDVTEKLALESSYHTVIKAQAATLDTLQEGVAVFGPDGRLKLHNAAFARIWALDEKDVAEGTHIKRVAEACATRFGDEAVWNKLAATIASGAERRRDWGEIERTDRTILSLSLAPLPDGATLVTFADVTDRFRIESALRERNDALEAADRLKSDFVHHASFLFRDPLNAVRGFGELLAQGAAGPLSAKQNEYVRDILTAANKLEEVTSDILDLAMIDSGAMRLELGRVDLYAMLARLAEPLRKHAESLDIKFTLACDPDVGMVVVDQRRVRQVAFNLLSNAFNYTPRGGMIVLGGDIIGDDVQISVSDTGPGIAPEVKANVFERFAAKGKSGQRAGAGLGLALVNRFVELHDGWVEIESTEKGTTVRCHLPRRLPDAAPKGGQRAAI